MQRFVFTTALAVAILSGHAAFAQVNCRSGAVRLLRGPSAADTWAVSFSRHYRHLQQDVASDALPPGGRKIEQRRMTLAATPSPQGGGRGLPKNVTPSYQHPDNAMEPTAAPAPKAAPAPSPKFTPAPSRAQGHNDAAHLSCCGAVGDKPHGCCSTCDGCSQSTGCGSGCCGHAAQRLKWGLFSVFSRLCHKCSRDASCCDCRHCGRGGAPTPCHAPLAHAPSNMAQSYR